MEGDVGDCFYNYRIPELGSWFGFDDPLPRSEWEAMGCRVGAIYSDDDGQYHEPAADCILYPCMEGMSMGWSWALYFANEATAYRVAKTGSAGGRDAMREREPAPLLWPGECVTGTYVDNVQVIGGVAADCRARMSSVSSRFAGAQIPFAVEEEKADLETLGFVYHFEEKRLRHRPKRVWRL